MTKHLYDSKLKCFIKGILPNGERDLTLDSSVTTLSAYEVLDPKDSKIRNTMDALFRGLWVKTEIGGLARYKNDNYRRASPEIPGNPWVIATLRLARWRIAAATSPSDLSGAMDLLDWAVKHALSSGALPEQLDPYSGKPISATPLLWSHAEYVLAVTEYISKRQELAAAMQSTVGSVWHAH
jgi:GH15 family glucan-1,4-alpha-glucosidase